MSLEVGNIYTAAEQYAAAERWYRRLLKAAPRQFGPLVVSLGRQNRPDEAVDVCLAEAKTDHSARPATILAGVLSAAQPSPEAFRRAEPLLAESLASHPDNAELLSAAAGVRVLQQRTDEAIEMYRRVVSLRPKDVLALNNLATLLAEQPQACKEALRSIDQAIGLAGRLPPLLDTKGTILVHEGKAEEAVPLLREATSGANADPAVSSFTSAWLANGRATPRRPRSPGKGPCSQFAATNAHFRRSSAAQRVGAETRPLTRVA